MADKIFRPRRGMLSTLVRKNIILRKGEMIFEVPDSGVGTGRCKIKLGDGLHKYDELPYAIDPEDCETKVLYKTVLEFNNSEKTTNAELLAEIKTGEEMGPIMGAIKKLLVKYSHDFEDVDTALGKKAPTDHSATATTYGVGTGSKYGHLKISGSIYELPTNPTGTSMSLEAGKHIADMLVDGCAEFLLKTESGETIVDESGSEILGEKMDYRETVYGSSKQFGVVKLAQDLFGSDADEHAAASVNMVCRLYEMIVNRCIEVPILTETGDQLASESGSNILGEVVI